MQHSIRPLGTGLTAIGLGVAVFLLVKALAPQARARTRRERTHDYSDRSGFPQGVEAARGAAKDFEPPRDMRIPEPLRPRVH